MGKFKDRATQEYYHEVCQVLTAKNLFALGTAIELLYQQKITSEVELPSYKINRDEINSILEKECGLDLNKVNLYVQRLQ